ncbi:MAG: PQQ-binding-like beta-propeller repeat protein [Pirellulales bacterium]
MRFQLSSTTLCSIRDPLVTWCLMIACVPGLSGWAHGAEGDWPRWRGIAVDGASTEQGLLTSWPQEGPPLAWRSKGLGRGFSSLAVVGDRIYTMGNLDDESHVFCLNRRDGSVLWKTPLGDGDPNSTPTVQDGMVYALARSGDLAALRAGDGTIVWTVSFTKDFGGAVPGWGYSESPLVDGNTVVVTPGGPEAFLVGLDKQTGKAIWKTAWKADDHRGHGGAGYASPVIGNGAGVRQYVTLTGKGLVGVDAQTGKLLWVYDRISNGTANIPTPIVVGDLVLTSSGYSDGGTALVKLVRSGDRIEPQELYYFEAKEKQNHHGGMILRDGYVYMGHGHNNGFPLCFKLDTGEDAWRPGRGPGEESAAVAYADGHLYFRYQNATMALVEATPRQYRLKGTFKLAAHNGESWSHPVIVGGFMYLRDQDELLVYDLRRQP